MKSRQIPKLESEVFVIIKGDLSDHKPKKQPGKGRGDFPYASPLIAVSFLSAT